MSWIRFLIEKPLQKVYNTCVFSGLAIYGYSNHETDITIEFASKTAPEDV